MFGGEQEKWLRPGTLPLHQIIGFGVASELAASRMDDDFKLMKHLSSYFLDKIKLEFFMYDRYKFLNSQQADIFGKNKKVPSDGSYKEKNWLKIAVIEKQG